MLRLLGRKVLRFVRRAWPCWLATVLLGAGWTLYSGACGEQEENEPLARWSYSLPFRLARMTTTPASSAAEGAAPPRVAITNAVLVEINNATTAHLDYRLDRLLYARLLERLAAAAPRLVFFDLLFVGPEETADGALVAAMNRHRRWIVGAAVERIPSDAGRFLRPREVPAIRHDETIRSIEPLMRPGHWGYLDLKRDPDSMIRVLQGATTRLPAAHPDNATAAWQAALLAAENPSLTESSKTERRWLRYYGTPGGAGDCPAFLRTELSQVLNMTEAQIAALFRDRYVFIGINRNTASRDDQAPMDIFPQPWSTTPCAGMEVQATAVMNLVRGDWLRRVPAWRQLALVAVWGTLITGLLTWNRAAAVQVAVLLGALALAAASARAQIHPAGGLWWPWLIPVLVQVPCALITSAWVPAWRARRKLVFISYRSADGQHHARHLQITLDSLGIPAFMEKGAIPGGDSYPEFLEQAVRRAPNLLLVLTEGARLALRQEATHPARPDASFEDDPGRWIPKEIALARAAGNHVVVLLPVAGPAKQTGPQSSTTPHAPPDAPTPNEEPLRARDLSEPWRFLAEIQPVRFRTDEFHAASLRQLVGALKIPRRVRSHATRILHERDVQQSEESEELSKLARRP